MKGALELLSVGSGKMFALIAATFPEGSECTCTNKAKTKTLAAKSTAGKWLFAIPEADEWTVKAELDGQSAEQTISIDHKGQHEKVGLSYHLYLFKEGVGVADGYSVVLGTQDNASVTAVGIVWSTNNGTGNSFMFDPKVDCSQYSKLCFELTCGTRNANSANYNVVFGVSANPVRGANYVDGYIAQTDKVWKTERDIYSLSLDGVSGTYYVLMGGYATTGTVHNVWLEK